MFWVLNVVYLEFILILIMVMPFTLLDTLYNFLLTLKHEISAFEILVASLFECFWVSRSVADPLFDESCLGVKGLTFVLRDEPLCVQITREDIVEKSIAHLSCCLDLIIHKIQLVVESYI